MRTVHPEVARAKLAFAVKRMADRYAKAESDRWTERALNAMYGAADADQLAKLDRAMRRRRAALDRLIGALARTA